jgi:extracellular elastinolytic metalloproteinase
MRTRALISLVAAGLALAAHSGSHAHGSVRKSLSFGQDHPRAGLRTLDVNGFTAHPNSDPVEVATALVRELTEHEFVVRKDSYTDKATGVTHVYFRQRVNGIEVADGDINVNVKDGLVLSYGNSVGDCFVIRGGVVILTLFRSSIVVLPPHSRATRVLWLLTPIANTAMIS